MVFGCKVLIVTCSYTTATTLAADSEACFSVQSLAMGPNVLSMSLSQGLRTCFNQDHRRKYLYIVDVP